MTARCAVPHMAGNTKSSSGVRHRQPPMPLPFSRLSRACAPIIRICRRCSYASAAAWRFAGFVLSRKMTAAGSAPIALLYIRPRLNLRHLAGFPPSLQRCRTGNAGNTPTLPRFKFARSAVRRCAPPVIFCCLEISTSVPVAPPASRPVSARNGRPTSSVPLRWAFGARW